jgi:hypothetical protein
MQPMKRHKALIFNKFEIRSARMAQGMSQALAKPLITDYFLPARFAHLLKSSAMFLNKLAELHLERID